MNKKIYKKDAFNNFFTVAPGVWGMKDVFVNMYMILNPFDGNWVLVDAGFKWSAQKIKKIAKRLFGEYTVPSAIILTHGHFDHVGALQKLVEEWNVPVFAHPYEIPYLTGKSSYPPPDPTVGGGLISLMSFAYPSSPINISNFIRPLPENGGVPGLPEWKYVHTPGHAPGHISLFRETDNLLIAGDAFVTTKAESIIATMFQAKKISGPPRYFTYDWVLARESVKNLATLEPEIIATSHGRPMQRNEFQNSLKQLSDHFYKYAVPSHGRYVNDPAITNATGVVYTPPNNINTKKITIKALAIIALVAVASLLLLNKHKKNVKDKDVLAYEVW